MTPKNLAATIGVVLLAVLCRSTLAGDEPKTARFYRQQAAAAYKAKNYALAVQNLNKALEIVPDHPTLIYNLAAMNALQGNKEQAIAFLSKITAMGLALHPERDADFSSIKDSPEFAGIMKRFESNNIATVINSTTAFTIRERGERGLITEGLAYDPHDGSFFISSIHLRKILRVSKNGDVTDFATEREGLWSVLGMKVDTRRQALWVTTTAFPQMTGFNKTDEGLSGVFKFDLRNGKVLKKYLLSNSQKKHALGDLTIQSNGDVFTTDSLSAAIYVIHRDRDELELFLEDWRFGSPQGLTFSNDERHLFMADYSSGLFDVDVSSKAVIHIAPIPGQTMLGIDGLYFYKGSLIGVQNGVTPQRVVRISLSSDLSRAEKLTVLEANNPRFLEPTLGVLVNDNFYFIANSQWPLVGDTGKLVEDKLQDPLVLKIHLPVRAH